MFADSAGATNLPGAPTHEAQVVRRRWIILAAVVVPLLLCGGIVAWLGDPIELIAHPGWREYLTLDQLQDDFAAVYMIQDSDLAPAYRTAAVLGPPRRIAVATRSGHRVTMYVEQSDRSWLKLDAWLRRLTAETPGYTVTFRYELRGGALIGSWQSSMGSPAGVTAMLQDSFDIPLYAGNKVP